MRQATLPWAASAHAAALSFVPTNDYADPHTSLDPALVDVDTPPYQVDTPPALPLPSPEQQQQQQQQHLSSLDPQLQLDPALFSGSQERVADPNQVIDVSTPEPIPQPIESTVDMTSSSSSSSSFSAATSSASIPVSTQHTEASCAPETASLPSADSTISAVTAAPASEPATKPPPTLHPFFRPGGPSSHTADSNDESDTELRRPARSSRAKAPVSYREDLKAVLRADKAQESARLKEEKRQAQLQEKQAKKALKPSRPKEDQLRFNSSQDTDGFELVESRVATPKSSSKQTPAQTAATSSKPSSSNPHQSPKKPEPRPLSLAVKGTSTAASTNPHPFFVKKPKQQPAPSTTQVDSVPGHVADDGEEKAVTSENAKSKAPAVASSSNFNTTPASWSLFAAQKTSSSKPKKPSYAAWPTHEDTHVAGLADEERHLLSAARSDLAAFRSRWQPSSTSLATKHVYEPPPSDFVAQMNRTRPRSHLEGISLTGSAEFSSTDQFVAQVRQESLSQPAVAFAKQQAVASRASGQLWADAFRPHLSCACLGNEPAAIYLLDWLRHLLVAAPGSVTTTDRKRKVGIQRRVDRPRKKRARRGYSDDDDDSDDMADFIVDDDEDEDAVGEYDESIADDEWFGKFSTIDRKSTLTDDECIDDLKSSQATAATAAAPSPAAVAGNTKSYEAASRSPHPEEFASLDRLTNCMILAGPSGSGKTASVYACAAQLGYEVFELYPGMGKRSGKELLAAVGDLGRNHMVSSGGVGGGATFKKTQPSGSAASASASAVTAASISASPTVRQSLILIEEADVLFEEDKGFWAAVVELVAESKRPVVIACNELDLVPVHDLPVQQVLEYVKPRLAEEVVPWLQMVASEMGRFVSADQVEAMVLNLPGTDHALDAGEGPTADLRQALAQMQFGHLASSSTTPASKEPQLDMQAANETNMKAAASAAESSSLADVLETCLGRQDEQDAFGDAGIDASSSSRQWGSWVQLVPQPLAWYEQRQALAGSAEVEYRSTLAEIHSRLNGGLGTASIMDAGGSCELGGVRVTQPLLKRLQQRQASRLHQLVSPLLTHRHSSSLLPPSLVIDYAPIVRLMALIDQDLAQIHASLHQQQQQQQQQQQEQQSLQSSSSSHSSSLPTTTMAGRSTRNSSRAFTSWLGISRHDYGYERWLAALGPKEVELARATALVF